MQVSRTDLAVGLTVLLGCLGAAKGDGMYAELISLQTARIGRVESPVQEALLHVDEPAGRVSVTLRTHFENAPGDLAWVIPVPAEPFAIDKADEDLFDHLDEATAPTFLLHSTEGKSPFNGGALDSAEQVTVLQAGTVGVYQHHVLAAREAKALETWLRDNNYRIPEGASRIFESYVQRGWCWLVFKVRPDAGQEGTLAPHPIQYTYRSRDVVFPMEISRLSSAPQCDIYLYVVSIDKKRYDVVEADWQRNELGTLWNEAGRGPNGKLRPWREVFTEAVRRSDGRLFLTEFSGSAELAPGNRPSMYVTRLIGLRTPRTLDRHIVLVAVDNGAVWNTIREFARLEPGERSRRAAFGWSAVALLGFALWIGFVSLPRRWGRRDG